MNSEPAQRKQPDDVIVPASSITWDVLGARVLAQRKVVGSSRATGSVVRELQLSEGVCTSGYDDWCDRPESVTTQRAPGWSS